MALLKVKTRNVFNPFCKMKGSGRDQETQDKTHKRLSDLKSSIQLCHTTISDLKSGICHQHKTQGMQPQHNRSTTVRFPGTHPVGRLCHMLPSSFSWLRTTCCEHEEQISTAELGSDASSCHWFQTRPWQALQAPAPRALNKLLHEVLL